jgi:hypothetical protein
MHSAWLGVLTRTLIVVLKVATSKWIHFSYERLSHGRMGWYVKYKVRETKRKICIVMLCGCKLTEMAHAMAYTRAEQEGPQR